MKKKILSLILTLAMVLPLIAGMGITVSAATESPSVTANVSGVALLDNDTESVNGVKLTTNGSASIVQEDFSTGPNGSLTISLDSGDTITKIEIACTMSVPIGTGWSQTSPGAVWTGKATSATLTSPSMLMGVTTIKVYYEPWNIATDGSTDENAYIIKNYDELSELAEMVNGGNSMAGKFIKLSDDFGKGSGTAEALTASIGNEDRSFNGTFDGNGQTVALNISSSNSGLGLFGRVGEGASVKNVTVTGSVTGTGEACYVGGIVGINFGHVKNCHTTGKVTSYQMVGGVVGYNRMSGLVINCSATGDVVATYTYSFVGGVAGGNDSKLINCYATGTVSGNQRVGGIAGQNSFDGVAVNCYAIGKVSGTSKVGGAIGNKIGTVTNCYCLLENQSFDASGKATTMTSETMKAKDATSLFVILGEYAASKAGKTAGCMEWYVDASKNNGYPYLASFDTYWFCGAEEGVGSTADNPYIIDSTAGLEFLALIINSKMQTGGTTGAETYGFSGKYIKLADDFDNSAALTTVIGISSAKAFRGTFNGNGKNVKLAIGTEASPYPNQGAGLFGYVYGGTVKNVTVSGAIYSSEKSVGGVAGNASASTIENCCFTGTISSAKDHVGGIAGSQSNNSIVANCYSMGNVSGRNSVGGVVGSNYAIIKNCYATGAVTATATSDVNKGGVVGYINDKSTIITDCYYKTGIAEFGIGGKTSDDDAKTLGMSEADMKLASGENGALVDKLNAYARANGYNLWEVVTPTTTYPTYISADTSWFDVSKETFVLENTADLEGLAMIINSNTQTGGTTGAKTYGFEGKTIKLADDFDNSVALTTVIGNSETKAFNGTFNGNGKDVKLAISATTEYVGMFGFVGTKGIVKNLSTSGAVTSTEWYVGGIAGYNIGTIVNCFAIGTLTGKSFVGGIVGKNHKGTIANCYATGALTSNVILGGIVGNAAEGTYVNCYAACTMTSDYIGGVFGVGTEEAVVKNCYYKDGTATYGAALYDGTPVSKEISGVLKLSDADMKLASGEDGALVDKLNTYAAESNVNGLKLWAQNSEINGGYPTYKAVDYTYYNTSTYKYETGSCSDYAVLTASSNTNLTEGWYVVAEDVFINQKSVSYTGNVNIILTDGSTFSVFGVTGGSAGITQNKDGMLSIYGQEKGTGILNANGSSFDVTNGYPGISGNITVHGGTVNATGAVGGGVPTEENGKNGGDGIKGNVTVYGGTVTACGGSGSKGGAAYMVNGNGKNGGNGGNGINGTVVVEGGKLYATGGNGGNGGNGNGTGTVGDNGKKGKGISSTSVTLDSSLAACRSDDGIDYEVATDNEGLASWLTKSSVKIGKKQSVTFSEEEITKKYGDAAFTLEAIGAKTTVTYKSSDEKVATVNSKTGEVTIIAAGEATITAIAADDDTYAKATGKYELTVDPKPLIVTPKSGQKKTYDGKTAAPEYTFEGQISGETPDFSGELALYEDAKNAGTHDIVKGTLALKDTQTFKATNYKLVVDDTVDYVITPKKLTIKDTTVSDKYYDGKIGATIVPGTLVGVVGKDDVKLEASGSYDDKLAKDEKDVQVDYVLAGYDAENYYLESDSEVIPGTIDKKELTVVGTMVAEKYYDGTTKAEVTVGTLLGVVEDDDVKLEATATFADKDAGKGKEVTVEYTLSGADAHNYVLAQDTETKEANIKPREITITSSDSSREYNGLVLTEKEVKVTSGSFVEGEGAKYSVTGSQTFVGFSPNIFDYTLNSNTKEGNYDITTVYGTLEVTKNTTPITITVDTLKKVYDGTPLKATCTCTEGVISEMDELIVTYSVPEITEVSSVDVMVDSFKIMHNDTDVTDYYTVVSTEDGKLTIELMVLGSDSKIVLDKKVQDKAVESVKKMLPEIESEKLFNGDGEKSPMSSSVRNILGKKGYVDITVIGVAFCNSANEATTNSKIVTYRFNVTPIHETFGEMHEFSEPITFRLPVLDGDAAEYKYVDVYHNGEFYNQYDIVDGYVEVTANKFSVFSYTLTNVKQNVSGGQEQGGEQTPTEYEVSIPEIKNGKIEVSPAKAKAGDVVTVKVTADKGYALDTLTVVDAAGKSIKLEAKGDTYTFVMPESKIEIKAAFAEEVVEPVNNFTDVSKNDFFYDAVIWAAGNGITSGVDSTHFNPYDSTNRAQMVTFLWRAAGSPEPTAKSTSFTDVNKDEYYYKAVLWAVENGITKGVSETSFAPYETVTRAQAVTFLYRYECSIGKVSTKTSNIFSDVKKDAYYYDAVLWAKEQEITSGVTDDEFAPDNKCNRSQIVTFLYRYILKRSTNK